MFGALKRKLTGFFVRVREQPLPKLSATDRKIVQFVSATGKATPNQVIVGTGMKWRNVYSRLESLTTRKILVNNGGVYHYIGPKKELRVTPFIGLLSIFGVISGYLLSNEAVAFFSMVFFAVSYLIEEKSG